MMRHRPEGNTVSAIYDIHPMTVPEYLQATELFGWEKTELIEGVVYDVPSEKNRHAETVRRLGIALSVALPDDLVYPSGSLDLSPWSMPEPDLYVVDRDADVDLDGYMPASEVRLIVEVSVSTLNRDLGPKLRAYAKASIPAVWVVDPRPGAGWLQRHTDPVDGRFQAVRRFEVGECAGDLDAAAVLGRV